MGPINILKTTTSNPSKPSSLDHIRSLLEKFWKLEAISIEDCADSEISFTHDELEAIKLVKKGSFYDAKEKRWYAPIPWRNSPPNVSDNYGTTFQVLKSVEKTAKTKNCVKEVTAAYDEMVLNKFARKLNQPEIRRNANKPVSYIPTFAVFTPDKQSTKVRIVMNCSSKTSTGFSLNHEIFPGPNLLPDLTCMLIRFRTGLFAFNFDVRKMYLNIKLAEKSDCQYFRFLWRDCNDQRAPSEYEMERLLFGLNCSPFIANFIVKEHAKKFSKKFPIGSAIALNECYIDDLITCLNTEQECVQAIKELNSLFELASMSLHKFNSNLPQLKKLLNDSQLADSKVTKILGQIWNVSTDQLCFQFTDFNFQSNGEKCTKRQFLSQAGQLYDPLGLIAPCLFVMKLLFQQIWIENIGWDEALPSTILSQWNSFKNQLPLLDNFLLPRCLFQNKTVKSHNILVFCDASNLGYAAVGYLFTSFQDQSVQASFVMAKTRIRPIKTLEKSDSMSIVRMELLSLLIGVRLAQHIKKSFSTKLSIDKTLFFTDSAINFFRLKKGFANFKPWVSNRLKEILTHSHAEDWFHIPSQSNIADIASRGTPDFQTFLNNSEWLNGPAFLYNSTDWSSLSLINSMKSQPAEFTDDEIKLPIHIHKIKPIEGFDLIAYLNTRYTCWHKTLKVASFIFRFARTSHHKFQRKNLTVEELNLTEKVLISLLQKQAFSTDYEALENKTSLTKSSRLLHLNPFLDNFCLKSNSRLSLSRTLTRNEKFPLILPDHSPLVEKMILWLHTSNKHLGLSHMLALVRSRFVLLKGRRELTRILRTCPSRACKRVVPLSQMMSALPSERLDGLTPFRNVGLDYLGPIGYTGFDKEMKVPKKLWVCLFTCLTTRAVHLEPVLNLETLEFLNALRMFISRRGLPLSIRSDNASQFKLADKELKTLLSKINWSKIEAFALEKNFEWKFIIPYTPHLQGATERLVSSIKKPIKKVLGNVKCTFRQMQVLLSEIEFLVNTRPLAPVQDDLPVPISPFQLLYGRNLTALPTQKNSQSLRFADMWLKRKHLIAHFWKLWKHDYLLSLGVRRKWPTVNTIDLLDKIVLLNDKDLTPMQWRMGKVIRCIPSKDGLIRTVEVQLPNSRVLRSVNTLSLFEQDFLVENL